MTSSTHIISLILPSDTQPKPFLLPCTINLFLPSLIKKSLACASFIFLLPLTPSTTTFYSKDCLPGSAFTLLLTLLSSGFNPISLLALSPLRHRNHHPNHTHSPVM